MTARRREYFIDGTSANIDSANFAIRSSTKFDFSEVRSASVLFTGVRGIRILGSSLSSGAARRRLRIRHETLEDGVADAPLEAPQSLLAGLALRHLLAVVGAAPSNRPCLAGGDHVQGVVELTIPGQ